MSDSGLRRWAQVMAQYCAPVKLGDEVLIRATTLAEPLVLELVRAVLEQGGYPHVRMSSPLHEEVFMRYAPDAVLDMLPDLTRYAFERVDIQFSILSESNTRSAAGTDPARMVRLRRTFRPLSELHAQRAAAGELLWCLTLYPTPAYAQEADMSLLDLTEFINEACFLNDEDPVGRWRALAARQQILVDHLDQAQEVHIRAPGTDLRVKVGGRTWINSDGKRNFPSGEVFTSPVEDQVSGHILFGFPAVYGGREVKGAQLWFEEGRVVRAAAEQNEAFLLEMLDTDEGSRYLGEVAFGTNYRIQRFMRNTLFDEKIGGTLHLALGNGFPEAGGKNQSAIHWDIVCDLRGESEVTVDGELFQKNGRFTMLEGGVV